MQAFTHRTLAARVVFGRGAVASLADEVTRLELSAVLVLSTTGQADHARALADQLGARAAGVFSGATMHTPIAVTNEAIGVVAGVGADGIVSFGGGSTTGLGKAIAARTGIPHIVIPTTYAGSEVTPILGETENGLKTTRSSPDILPDVVIYDPALTDTLPVRVSVASGLNAMAHAVEGIYARDGSPLYTLIAVEGLAAMHEALPMIKEHPSDPEARDSAMYGAWLCGTVLGNVGMSVHHKLCHTLGGALDLPHGETHAVMLPHSVDFVEQTVPDALAPAANILGPQAGPSLWDFAAGLGAPQSLRELGVQEYDLNRIAELATANSYWAPRAVEREGIRALLQSAWTGSRPEQRDL